MMKRIFIATTIMSLLIVGAFYLSWRRGDAPQTREITLHFVPNVGGAPLEFNKFSYRNPAGDQPFKIHKFRFYLTNVVLDGEGGSYVEPESYHLVRFDNAEKSYSIILRDVPLKTIERIAFSIGPDEAANGSIATVGDLDPNSQMAWNWEVGYKFVLMEGGLDIGDTVEPLVYHIGFNENHRDLEFAPAQNTRAAYRFDVDAMMLFNSVNTIDMAALPSVKFDKTDAALLADNYATMISLHNR